MFVLFPASSYDKITEFPVETFFARHCYGYDILQSKTRNSFRSHKSTTTGLFSFSTCTCNMIKKLLTLRRFREVRGEECGITVSLVGMDPDINFFFNWINSPFSRGTVMGLCSKQLSSKWTEQRTDEFEGLKSLRCLRTNLIHFWRTT